MNTNVKIASWETYLMLFFGMALFGSATPLSKLVTQAFPTFIAGGLRVLLAFLVLLPFIKISNLKNYHGRDRWLLCGISLFGVVGFTAFMLYGMKLVTGVSGSAVMSATPAVTASLSVIFFKDKVTCKKIFSLLLAILGVLFLQLKGGDPQSSGGHSWWGLLLIFAAVCCEASYTLMGKALTKTYPPEEISGLSALIAVICFIPFSIWQYPELHIEKITMSSWLYLAAYGLITMGLGSVLWYKGISKVEGSIAASFMGVMPVSALVLSYVLLQEKFEWLHLIGFGLVFGGVLLMISVHREMEKFNSDKSMP
jgi:drug/metabolite transporter (DMT)-like permease